MSVGADRVGEAISEARREGETTLYGRRGLPPLRHASEFRWRLIEEIASDEGVQVDVAGFESELAAARERSKGASKFEHEGGLPADDQIDPSWTTEFRGYPEQDFVRPRGREGAGPAFQGAR